MLLAIGLALATVAPAQSPPDPHGSSTKWDLLARRLASAGVDDTPEALIEAVQNHDRGSVRSIAAMLLGERGGPSAQPVLLGVSRDDSDPTVRLTATGALCGMVSEGECSALLAVGFEAATSPEEQLDWGCQLARRGDPRGLPLFRRRLEDPDTRRDTMRSLDCFLAIEAPDFDPKGLLFEWLGSEDPEVRGLAVNEAILGLLSGDLELGEVEASLEALTRDDDPAIRRQAEAALIHGRQKQAEAPASDDTHRPDPNDTSDNNASNDSDSNTSDGDLR